MASVESQFFVQVSSLSLHILLHSEGPARRRIAGEQGLERSLVGALAANRWFSGTPWWPL